MPWKPLSQICREVEQLPLPPFTPTEATKLTGVLAHHLGVNPSEISLAALEAAWFTIPKCLEFVMHRDAREMKWLVSGRRSPEGKREVIRPDHWAFLTMDIEHHIARDLDGKVVYADLKGAFGNDLTEEEWQSVEHQLAPPSPAPVSKAGAEDRAPASNALHTRPQSETAKFRKRLREWIEEFVVTEEAQGLVKTEILQRARLKFKFPITENMFREVWRAAEIPAGFRNPGVRLKRTPG